MNNGGLIMETILKINNLHSSIQETKILKGLNLEMKKGEIHAIMGPNGAGKSTLAYTLMGNPKYEITDGQIEFCGEEMNDWKVEDRAKKGVFLSFQHPEEVPGVTIENFLRVAKGAVSNTKISMKDYKKMLKEKMELLDMKSEYASRYVNVGFSGGEKKKNEILQMSILEPKLAILDETDSGLDMDALKVVANGVKKTANSENAILIITHYERLLEYIKPDFVHVLVDGRIVRTGDLSVVEEIEKYGYESISSQSKKVML
jgi:Fe-S cluster assembly ATP-binding protein